MGSLPSRHQRKLGEEVPESVHISADQHQTEICDGPTVARLMKDNNILVIQIDWTVPDCEKVVRLFQKFGRVLSAEPVCHGTPSALVTFENANPVSEVLQMPSEDVIFKNKILMVDKALVNKGDSPGSMVIDDNSSFGPEQHNSIAQVLKVSSEEIFNNEVLEVDKTLGDKVSSQGSVIIEDSKYSRKQQNYVPKLLKVPSEDLIFYSSDLVMDKALVNTVGSQCIMRLDEDRFSPEPPVTVSSGETHDATVETTPIHRLPVELLDYIFSFLDIRNRIQSEMVCKNWQRISWGKLWSEPKEFAFGDWKRGEKSSLFGVWHLTNEILEGILFRFGLVLRNINLSNLSHQVSITSNAFEIISCHCPNLSHIEVLFSNLSLSPSCLTRLGKGCPKLKVVKFEYLDGEEEIFRLHGLQWPSDKFLAKESVHLKSFFESCRLLESLTLIGEPLCPKGSDFDAINENLKILRLISIRTLQPSTLIKVKDRCICLEELFVDIRYESYKLATKKLYFDVMENYCDTLKVLNLMVANKGSRDKWCAYLSKFHRIQELYIDDLGNFQCNCDKNCAISNRIRLFSALGSTTTAEQGEDFVKNLLDRNDDLQDLQLAGFGFYSKGFLKLLVKYAHAMTALEFIYCSLKSYKANNWCELFSVLRNLNKLCFVSCITEFDDAVIQTISRNCLKLKILDFSSMAMTDAGLLALSCLPCLVDVSLRYMNNITDQGIRVLAMAGRLEKLNINTSEYAPNTEIGDASCCLLAQFCPNFRELQAENVLYISNQLVLEFYECVVGGYSKPYGIKLNLTGTSATRDYKKHDRLFVIV